MPRSTRWPRSFGGCWTSTLHVDVRLGCVGNEVHADRVEAEVDSRLEGRAGAHERIECDAPGRGVVPAVRPADRGLFGEGELAEVTAERDLRFCSESLGLDRVSARAVLELGCLARVRDTCGLDRANMCRREAGRLGKLHRTLG